MMVIAAIAVHRFQHRRHRLDGGLAAERTRQPRRSAAVIDLNGEETARTGATFQCAECGVIESIRELERGA